MVRVKKLLIVDPPPQLFFGIPASLTFVFESPVAAGDYSLKGDTEFASRAPVIAAETTLPEASSQITFEIACNSQAYLDRILTANTKLRIQVTGPDGVVVYHEINASPSINPTDIPTEEAPRYYNAEESDARFATLQSVADLTGSIGDIKADTEQIISDVAAIEAKVDDMIDHMDAKFGVTDAAIAGVLAEITALGGAIDNYRNMGA